MYQTSLLDYANRGRREDWYLRSGSQDFNKRLPATPAGLNEVEIIPVKKPEEKKMAAATGMLIAAGITGAAQLASTVYGSRKAAKVQREGMKMGQEMEAAGEIYNRAASAQQAARLNPYRQLGLRSVQDLARGTRMKGATWQPPIATPVDAAYAPSPSGYERPLTIGGTVYNPSPSQLSQAELAAADEEEAVTMENLLA